MSKRRFLRLWMGGLVCVCLAQHALAQETDIQNWTAPPYWAPADHTDTRPARGRTMEGRQALAVSPTALPFISLSPCRLVDTRGNAPLSGGFLPAATVRSYTLAGVCGVPSNAQAISLNATVVKPVGPGFLVVWPEGGTFPPVSTLNYVGNDVIANAAVVPLSATGGVSIVLGVSGADVILDTNGYYAPVPTVTSLNSQTGDMSLVAGSNVTITPSGQTLTIAATGGGGGGPPTGAAGGSLTGTYPNPGIADGAVTDAKVASVSFGKVSGVPGFVLKAGDTMTGTLVLNPGNIDLKTDPSTPSSGAILKNGYRFLHDFGSGNTFVGLGAGNFSMTGANNTATGADALLANTTGSYNTATGRMALRFNATGSFNTASGAYALFTNSNGNYNTASGAYALYTNTTGSYNTASGYYALLSNTTGNENAASGYSALEWSTTGSQNTAVGYLAGARTGAGTGYSGSAITFVANATGNFNTFLGHGTGATADVRNCTAVGIDAYCDGNDQVRLGNFWVTSIGGKVAWSALSDARAKKEIRNLGLGLDFVLRLRPVEYKLKTGNERTDMGFLAQDVEALLGEEYNVLTVGGDPDRTLSLRYSDLIAPLVKAVQEQQAMLLKNRDEMRALQARLRQLESPTAGSSRRPDSR